METQTHVLAPSLMYDTSNGASNILWYYYSTFSLLCFIVLRKTWLAHQLSLLFLLHGSWIHKQLWRSTSELLSISPLMLPAATLWVELARVIRKSPNNRESRDHKYSRLSLFQHEAHTSGCLTAVIINVEHLACVKRCTLIQDLCILAYWHINPSAYY